MLELYIGETSHQMYCEGKKFFADSINMDAVAKITVLSIVNTQIVHEMKEGDKQLKVYEVNPEQVEKVEIL